MFEKVNPCHPDKVADRIAGALVDIAYETQVDPKVAVEVLIGHGICHIIAETSAQLNKRKVMDAVHRIARNLAVDYVEVPQDGHLANNQVDGIRCGDNGIFKGVPVTAEQKKLSAIARGIYAQFPYDGKYILNGEELTICQSNAISDSLRFQYPGAVVNPLGDWTGGTDVDTGATNRKLGSDMADSVTGGGLHGNHRHPLIDWNITEAECLQYCYDHGFHWGGLYEIFHRVSCWCCPLQSLSELRKLYRHFPELWNQLKKWDSMTWRNFRADYSVLELEKRFDFEEEWQKAGKPLRSKAFYSALKNHLASQTGKEDA